MYEFSVGEQDVSVGVFFFFFQAEDGIRDLVRSRGLGDVYKRQVTTIGIATIAPLFGVRNLGYLIFQGFNTSYKEQVMAGVIAVSALAIIADVGLLLAQRAVQRGRQTSVVARG